VGLEDVSATRGIPDSLDLSGIQVDRNKYPNLQRNASLVKGGSRILPKPIVLQVKINGQPARALVDSGSLGDFMSTTLADQLKVKKVTLNAPLGLQLAVQGSRSRHFDIINLNSYDIILGTPWLFVRGRTPR
jgi:hypothetical protein